MSTLQENLEYDGNPAQVTIEIRVTADGKLELYADEPIDVRPFEEWRP